ncbi:hypothetical protein TcasGA2_TC000907 [Tribolium castaneum]|uniref:Uncharacterized protein n=1 Tax=Tribolium castaneum TaxID=7070 RepID=D6W924_TRICA|nr:hypothetical protein TcasGA2_TC000907 [Tribolium castaneum]
MIIFELSAAGTRPNSERHADFFMSESLFADIKNAAVCHIIGILVPPLGGSSGPPLVAKSQVDLLNLHLVEFVFQMKSVNHVAAWRRAENCRQSQFSFLRYPLSSASSKLLHINLFAAVLVTLIILRHIESSSRDEGGPQSGKDKLGDCSGLQLSNAASVRVCSSIYLAGASILYLILDLYLAIHPRNLMHYYTLKYNFENAINPPTWVVPGSDKERRIVAPPARITKQIDQDWNQPS